MILKLRAREKIIVLHSLQSNGRKEKLSSNALLVLQRMLGKSLAVVPTRATRGTRASPSRRMRRPRSAGPGTFSELQEQIRENLIENELEHQMILWIII